MKKLIFKIAKLRVLDGYICILGVVLFYKVLADYSGWLHIIDISMRAWRLPLFSVDLSYHARNKNNSNSAYPPFTGRVTVLKFTFLDTTREPARITSEKCKAWDKEREARKAEEKRLIEAAQEAGL